MKQLWNNYTIITIHDFDIYEYTIDHLSYAHNLSSCESKA